MILKSLKLCKSGHFQKAFSKQRKLVYPPILHKLFQISYTYFQPTFHVDLLKLFLQYFYPWKEGNALYIIDGVNFTIF